MGYSLLVSVQREENDPSHILHHDDLHREFYRGWTCRIRVPFPHDRIVGITWGQPVDYMFSHGIDNSSPLARLRKNLTRPPIK